MDLSASLLKKSLRRPLQPVMRAVMGCAVYGASSLKLHALIANALGEMLGVKKGTGDLTEACTSVRYLPDHEGVFRAFGANEPARVGGRIVENLAPSSNDPSGANWIRQTGAVVTAIDDYWEFDITACANSAGVFNSTATLGAGQECTASLWLRSPSGSGTVTIADGSNGSFIQDVTVTEDWQRFAVTGATVLGSTISTWVRKKAGGLNVVHFKELLVEDVTGQTDQSPGEYLETIGSSTNEKIFNYANGNTVLSNVVTEAKGVDFDPQPRLYTGPAGTNSALYSNDLTNAAWSKSNMTVAFDAEGVDGAPNNGSTLTATAANATILQTVTASSDTHASRFFLRRLTGTGTVEITVDGGTTWTSVTLTAAYQEFIVDKASLTNPQFGVRIVTSGDEVEVGNGECHLASAIAEVRGTSPVFTSGASVTVNATNMSFDMANHDDVTSLYFLEYTPQFSTSEASGIQEILTAVGGGNLFYYEASSGKFEVNDGTTTADKSHTLVAGVTYKVGLVFGEGLMRANIDGAWGIAKAYDGAFPTGSALGFMNNIDSVVLSEDLRRIEYTTYEAAEEAMADLQNLGPELVVNGGFDIDLSGWTDSSEALGSTSWSSGQVELINGGGTSDEGIVYQEVTVEAGETYLVSLEHSTGNSIAQGGTVAGGDSYFQSPNQNSTEYSAEVTPAGTSLFVTLRNFNAVGSSFVDNVSVRKRL